MDGRLSAEESPAHDGCADPIDECPRPEGDEPSAQHLGPVEHVALRAQGDPRADRTRDRSGDRGGHPRRDVRPGRDGRRRRSHRSDQHDRPRRHDGCRTRSGRRWSGWRWGWSRDAGQAVVVPERVVRVHPAAPGQDEGLVHVGGGQAPVRQSEARIERPAFEPGRPSRAGARDPASDGPGDLDGRPGRDRRRRPLGRHHVSRMDAVHDMGARRSRRRGTRSGPRRDAPCRGDADRAAVDAEPPRASGRTRGEGQVEGHGEQERASSHLAELAESRDTVVTGRPISPKAGVRIGSSAASLTVGRS